MKKVVLINSCMGLYGGIESFLLNIFNSLDLSKFEVTFLTCGKTTYEMYKDEIESKGGKIDEIPIFANSFSNQLRLYQELRKYFKRTRPDIVHINSGGLSFHYLAAKAAKAEGIEKVILHSHNFIPSKSSIKTKVKDLLKERVVSFADTYLACSTGAAKWIFPEKLVKQGNVTIIPNGIDTEKFTYSEANRVSFREELGLGEELVIGNIGRFQKQKNHPFMLKMMTELVKKEPNAKLLLVGEGELRQELEKEVSHLGLKSNIIFLGERKDMPEFFSAIDVFVLPSLFEGFGIVAIEAQASGLNTLLSETIPRDTNVTQNAHYLPIEGELAVQLWVDSVLSERASLSERYKEAQLVKAAGYDKEVCCEKMQEIYLGVDTIG